MKTQRTIEVTIESGGNIQIEGIGFQGSDCEKATKFLEEALGTVTTRTKKPKPQVMWGCWVTFQDGGSCWGWETPSDGFKQRSWCPTAFTENRRHIMPLVKDWRSMSHVRSATPKKVTLPVPGRGS